MADERADITAAAARVGGREGRAQAQLKVGGAQHAALAVQALRLGLHHRAGVAADLAGATTSEDTDGRAAEGKARRELPVAGRRAAVRGDREDISHT